MCNTFCLRFLLGTWINDLNSRDRFRVTACPVCQVCQSQAPCSPWQREAKQTKLGLYEYSWLSMCFLVFTMHLE